jgi:hypothetical protein
VWTSLAHIVRLYRPRALTTLIASQDDLRRQLRTLSKRLEKVNGHGPLAPDPRPALDALRAEIAAAREASQAQTTALSTTLTATVEALEAVTRRERQLRTVIERDAQLEDDEPALDEILDEAACAARVAKAIRRAELRLDPCPHIVVDDLFPGGLARAMVRGLPPTALFEGQTRNKEELAVPIAVAPRYTRRVWRFVALTAAPLVTAAVVRKFHDPLAQWCRTQFPGLGAHPLAAMQFTQSHGRILLRRPGYVIAPHRDPKWGFLTCLYYLPRKGDDHRWGTQLFSVDGDGDAANASPHWIDPARCRVVETVEFRPNRALIFLNSTGAHGASIPSDAEPQTLERYAYQFSMRPTEDTVQRVVATLPPERRAHWAGASY